MPELDFILNFLLLLVLCGCCLLEILLGHGQLWAESSSCVGLWCRGNSTWDTSKWCEYHMDNGYLLIFPILWLAFVKHNSWTAQYRNSNAFLEWRHSLVLWRFCRRHIICKGMLFFTDPYLLEFYFYCWLMWGLGRPCVTQQVVVNFITLARCGSRIKVKNYFLYWFSVNSIQQRAQLNADVQLFLAVWSFYPLTWVIVNRNINADCQGASSFELLCHCVTFLKVLLCLS